MQENLSQLVEQSYRSSPKYTEIMAGFPEDYNDVKTLGDLLSINYKLVDVKTQLRRNLISLMEKKQTRYPGIIGYDDDVVPALDRAILSGHDVFLIGQIGQAKTKIIETIAHTLLSPIPIIKNSITNDCPMDLPQRDLVSILEDRNENHSLKFYISPESIEKICDDKLDTKIEWVEGKKRFKYVLATPDISVKDLVGYIDAVKVAKKGVEMYKIESYSPGQLMQAKHGIFCIDELPVLDPRKQVALLSVLQEGRFTTGSYPVIFEPRTTFFATANPIDYTHSGKVIEPLYDRLKSHIHTHYPKNIVDEMLIILQEAELPKSVVLMSVLETLASAIQKTRSTHQVNQERGVSVRIGVHGLELLVGEAQRTRSLSNKLVPTPRLSDMHCLNQVAKFELAEMDDTIENREKVFSKIISDSIRETCLKFLENIDSTLLESIKEEFGQNTFAISQSMIWSNGKASYQSQLEGFKNLKKLVERKLEHIRQKQDEFEKIAKPHNINVESLGIQDENELRCALAEIILEGLCWTTPKVLDKKEAGYVAA